MSNEAVIANPLGTERISKLMVRFAVPRRSWDIIMEADRMTE